MAIIRRSANGTWAATVQHPDLRSSTRHFLSKTKAVQWARAAEKSMGSSHHAPAGNISLGAAMNRYLRTVSSSKRPLTQLAETRRAKPLVKFFGLQAMGSITPVQVAGYRDMRLAQRPSGKGCGGRATLSTSTVRLELALLGHLFSTAIKEWNLPDLQNPVARIRRPVPAPGRSRRLGMQEEAQARLALGRMPNPILSQAFCLALETAMRLGEIRNLTLDQIDIGRRVVVLHQTKNGRTRSIPLSERATDALMAAMKNNRPTECALLFPGQPGADGETRPYRLEFAWWRVKVRLGITDLRFHDLRHEAISRLVEAGLSDLEVASISGHRSMQMLQRYTHLRAHSLVEKLDRINFGRRSEQPSSDG